MKRKDLFLAHMDAYAADKVTDALLLKYIGVSDDAKIVKSKLLTIDPVTKALLVKWVGSVPVPTGAQIVTILEALTGNSKLKAEAIRILDAGNHYAVKNVESALQEIATNQENMMTLIYLGL